MNQVRNQARGIWGVIVLGALFVLTSVVHGEESRQKGSDTNTETQQSTTKEGSGTSASDVMNWIQRFGNRVGDNISEAVGKTTRAIENAVKEDKEESQSESQP